ncbi:hypothetical protein BY996DRAFT_6413589 [Phakopsora pachyrhizi]|nr:hypothetical protein BY996DRAFT_6413589 [Phakopsora pachyrhizi]
MVDQSVETQIRTTVTDDEVDVGIDYHSKLLAHWMRSASDWHRSYQLSSTHCLTHSINPTNPIDSYLQQQQQNSSEYQHHQTSASTSTSTSTSNSNITTHSAILSTPISTGNGHGQHQPVILADRSTQTIRPTGSSSPSLIATDQPDDRPQEGVHILAPVTPSPTPVRIRSEGENCHRSFTAEEVSSSRERSEESHHQTVTRGRITDSKRRRVSSSSIEQVNLLESGQVDDGQQTRSLSIASSSTAVERQKVLRDEEPERKRGRRSVRDDDLSLSAYDRLSVRERDRRFPDVKGWVSFLNRSIDENEVDVRVRSRKSRLDLRGFRVYYLLDSTIRERLNETDRTIMMRLKESGARISDDLLDPSEISHVIISEPGSDWKTFEQLVRRKFVDDRDRSAKFIRRCSADHSSEGHPGQPRIWVLDVNWVETCLKHQTLVSEHLMSIRPDQRNGSSSSSRRSASERHQHLDSQEDDQSGGSLRKNSLEEVLSVEDDDEDEIETSVVLPRGGLVLLSKQQQPAINEDRTNTDSTDRSDHRNNAQINCAAGVSNSSSRNVKRALVGLESQVKLAHLGEGDTDEETSVDLSSENNVEGPYFSSSSTTKSTKNLVDRKNGRKKKDGLKEKGYDCERSGSVRFDGPNEDICQRMEEILKLYGNNPNDLFRILSLRKSIGILRSLNRRVCDYRSLINFDALNQHK